MTDFVVTEEVIRGIEHVTVTPATPVHDTPILMLHGMWHGAWVWRDWQEKLAAKGWTSTAISLPGHGGSDPRNVRFATMGQYLEVLADVVAAMEPTPILLGHSMGGALIQWYLARISDALPAVVLVSPWTAHSTMIDGGLKFARRDPWGFLKTGLTLSTDPMIRTPEVAAKMLLGPNATVTPEALHAQLCPESALVLNQHNPPFWRPNPAVEVPMLWLAAEKDAAISLRGAKRSAQFYGAAFRTVTGAGHNIMMDAKSDAVLAEVNKWLARITSR